MVDVTNECYEIFTLRAKSSSMLDRYLAEPSNGQLRLLERKLELHSVDNCSRTSDIKAFVPLPAIILSGHSTSSSTSSDTDVMH